MNSRDFVRMTKESSKRRLELSQRKRKDYATSDVLSNFKRVAHAAKILQIPQLWMIRPALAYSSFMELMKLDRRINVLIRSNGVPANEGITDTFDDGMVYSELSHAIYREKVGKPVVQFMNPFIFGRKIWKNYIHEATYESNKGIGLLRSQINEIRESERKKDWFHVALEYADTIFIADHAIMLLGYDTEALMLYRLQSRMLGKTKRIVAKYDKKLDRLRPPALENKWDASKIHQKNSSKRNKTSGIQFMDESRVGGQGIVESNDKKGVKWLIDECEKRLTAIIIKISSDLGNREQRFYNDAFTKLVGTLAKLYELRGEEVSKTDIVRILSGVEKLDEETKTKVEEGFGFFKKDDEPKAKADKPKTMMPTKRTIRKIAKRGMKKK